MADTKISAMTDVATLAGGDKFAVADVSDLTVSKYATLDEINTAIRSLKTPNLPTAAGTAGYNVKTDGTGIITYPSSLYNASVAAVSAGYAADTYVAGSSIVIAAGDWKVKGIYRCRFDMTKTAAGLATPIITVRIGTAGTTADAAIITFT